MKTSKQIFDAYNEELKQKLIPLRGEAIETNFVTDCNDPYFDMSFEEIKNNLNLKK
jgi:hypothetical protein